VRGLYHYLNREGLCDHDPANGLAPPKGERRLPKTLDTDRALQLLEGAVEDDFLARRIRRFWSCSTPPACAFPS
jgi:integrase/recombinase XerC